HTTAGYTMLTGMRHPRANDVAGATSIRPAPEDHPHLGSSLAQPRPARSGLPPFVTLPEVVRDAGVNELPGQGAGRLGGRYAPLLFEADTRRGAFPPPDVFAPPDLGAIRLDGRRTLREQLDR